jgi:hypothetical protein
VRRVVGVVASAALVLALTFGIGRAAGLPVPFDRVDLGSQLMLTLFGEISDSGASFAAARGDRASESPLRDLALQVRPQGDRPYAAQGVADFAQDRLAASDLAIEPDSTLFGAAPLDEGTSVIRFSAPARGGDAAELVPPSAHFTAAYQPPPPEPAISPGPGTLAFSPPQMLVADSVPAATHVGAVRFEGATQDAQGLGSQLSLHDASYNAGANFDLRAGKRSVSLNLSSAYEQVASNAGDAFSTSAPGSTSSWQLPGVAPLAVPNDSDFNRLSLGAGLSVPVVHGLTLNLNYDAQRLYGVYYGVPGLMNLDTVSNTYGGNLTFNIPQTSGSLSIGAYQDRFQDGILPINGQTQTHEDVNFTVKF